MNITKIISIVLCCLIIIILLKKLNNDYALLASCIINISVTVFSIGILVPVFEYINQLTHTSSSANLCTILFKSAGICLLCSVGAEICRDSGEASLASRIEFAGKCTLIAYSLPLIKDVFNFALSFID